MSDQRHLLSDTPDSELAPMLRDLSTHIIYPATPDIATRVRSEIETTVMADTSPGAHPRRGWLWLAAAVLALLLGALMLFPPSRTAIADRLGLSGVAIEWGSDAPIAIPEATGAELALGRRVTLDEAQRFVEFPIVAPIDDSFRDPPEVFVSGRGRTAMVSFVYPMQPGLPETEVAGVGALLTQFPGDTDVDFIRKGLADALGGGETTIEAVDIDGEPGFWIAGKPHGVFLACLDDGRCREERYRLAGNVLLWERDGLTLRFESSLSRDEALAFATSLEELGGGNRTAT